MRFTVLCLLALAACDSTEVPVVDEAGGVRLVVPLADTLIYIEEGLQRIPLAGHFQSEIAAGSLSFEVEVDGDIVTAEVGVGEIRLHPLGVGSSMVVVRARGTEHGVAVDSFVVRVTSVCLEGADKPSYFPLDDDAVITFGYVSTSQSFGYPWVDWVEGELSWTVDSISCVKARLLEDFEGVGYRVQNGDTTEVKDVSWSKVRAVQAEGDTMSVEGYNGLDRFLWRLDSSASVDVSYQRRYNCQFGGCDAYSFVLRREYGLVEWSYTSDHRHTYSVSLARR